VHDPSHREAMTSVNRGQLSASSRRNMTAHGVHASGGVTGLLATGGAFVATVIVSCALAAAAFGHAWLGIMPVAAVLLVVAPVGLVLVRQYSAPREATRHPRNKENAWAEYRTT
jgi:Flp pilus assembly protein TadB